MNHRFLDVQKNTNLFRTIKKNLLSLPMLPNCYKIIRIFFSAHIKKCQTNQQKKKKPKFKKLSNDLIIKLIKGYIIFVFNMKKYIDNGENLNKKLIDLSIKSKQIAFCINYKLSLSRFVDIESMKIISSDVDINKKKVKLVK